MTQQQILESYEITKNMSETARILDVSPQTVKRVLISNGIYPSKRAQQIANLNDLGLNVSDIAEFLKISEDTVRSNLPYTKGGYATGQKSKNAVRVAMCRTNKKAKSQKNEDEI